MVEKRDILDDPEVSDEFKEEVRRLRATAGNDVPQHSADVTVRDIRMPVYLHDWLHGQMGDRFDPLH